jgi:competence protein ComEC
MSQPATPSAAARPAYQPLVIVFAAACGGIVLDRVAPFSLVWWWLAAVASWVAWCVLWRLGYQRAAALPLVACLAATGATWHHCQWSLFACDHVALVAREAAAPAAIEARARSASRRVPAPPPDPLRTLPTPERTRIEIDLLAVRDCATWRPVSGTATLLVDGHLLDIRSGDHLRVFGQLASIRGAANPGEFDFARQARASRRLCWLSTDFPECVSVLTRGSRWGVSRGIDFLHTSGDALLWRSLGPRRAGLASAMFLGSREELDRDEAQAFMETGTIHLLVISGLNVGILASCLFLLMRTGLVPRPWALAGVALASVLYAAATDSQPPVVRATVMVLAVCAAMTLGRRALAFNTIAAAGLVVLALNPAELFQAGTQLSFLSVAVLAWFAQQKFLSQPREPLDRLIAGTRPWPQRIARRFTRETWRLTAVSFLIWLVVCPLVMARFHLVSPVAVLLGPILSVPVAVAMAAGFGIFAVGWIMPMVAAGLGWVCERNLMFVETCVAWARGSSAGHFWVSGPSEWWLLGFYGALACWVFAPRLAPPRRWCLAGLAGWSTVGLMITLLAPRDPDRMDCTFLSVGHGEAVVVELPGGRTLLYDAGRLGSPTSAARSVAGFLWSRGITHLDAVVLSHADLDHYNALPDLLQKFSVGVVYVSPMMFDRPNRALETLRGAIHKAGVPLREVWSGDRLQTGGDASLGVLHPPRGGVLGSDNANSIVLALEYQGRRLLFTGDLESPGLEDVMAELPYECDVLQAPHHGSPNSDPPGFAQWSAPTWTVISGGERDRLEVVKTAYASRGSQVLHTADAGAIHVGVADGRILVDRWHSDDP